MKVTFAPEAIMPITTAQFRTLVESEVSRPISTTPPPPRLDLLRSAEASQLKETQQKARSTARSVLLLLQSKKR